MSKDQNVIISGFGGQGTLMMGKLIAVSGMTADKQVSWIPSYGPEMRGGTANCTVRVSDKPIGSPVVGSPNTLVVMNQPSLDKFEPTVEKDGLMIVNSSMVKKEAQRKDIKVICVPATDLAGDKLGNPKLANMILFGTLLKHTQFVTEDEAMKALESTVSKKYADLLPLNKQAIKMGMEY